MWLNMEKRFEHASIAAPQLQGVEFHTFSLCVGFLWVLFPPTVTPAGRDVHARAQVDKKATSQNNFFFKYDKVTV